MRGKKLWALLLSACLLIFLAVPAMAADPEVTKKDLKGISPQHHKYLFSVIGGAAVGAGIGYLLGSGNDITKLLHDVLLLKLWWTINLACGRSFRWN